MTGGGTWNAGTTYQWEINDLAGDAGDANGDGFWLGLSDIHGALTIAGDAITRFFWISLHSTDIHSPYGLTNQLGDLGGIQRPAKRNRQHKEGYEFPILYADGGISGFNANHFEIEYTHFYQQWDDPFHIWNLSLSGDGKRLF